ncbi:MAG TPA: beta-galactosidase [Vicinamibacterales bacterium]|nr:beta-galactosidase [Vicinamibacterales bacterium]
MLHRCCAAVAAAAAALAAAVGAQQAPGPQGAALLGQREAMSVGIFYYPEQWPRNQWKRDIDTIARLGFDFTHYAEFSWTFLEPEEGRFDFAWLDDAIELADRAGLRVILGTPSAAPPSWMGTRYPEIYRIDEHGRRHEHGIRAEASLTSPVYQALVDRIVTKLAERYGPDRRVWGWQIDNEPGTFNDYSASARDGFRRWLRDRYDDVDRMNAVWGGSFWSSRYASFDEVLIPNAVLAAEDKLSPHALLDFARFQADTTAQFLDRQSAILERHARPGQWVTTNYTNVTTATDPRRSKGMDFLTFTVYPVAGANVLGGDSYAIGNPTRLMEAAAYYRPITGTFGVMELQPGQVNWAPVNPQPLPGAVGMWIWHAFGAGSSMLSSYRYRHPLRGSEMYHEGIVGTDGVTLSRTGREFVETMAAIKGVARRIDPRALMSERMAARRTGLLWSHDVFWDLEIQPQTTEWKTWAHRNTVTLAVKSAGAPLDFVAEDTDFSRYPFLVAPAYQMVSEDLVAKWRRYVEGGGHLVLTCRTGQKNAQGHFHEGPWAQPILDLIGADVEGFDMLPSGVTAAVEAGGARHAWHRWADILVPRAGTETLATYADRYYAGRAAATTRRLGRGTVTMIGVSTDDGVLERRLLRDVFRRAGVAIEDLPNGVFLEWRDGLYVAVNYSPAEVPLTVPPGASVLHGRTPLPPTGVLVWADPQRKR